jgi:2-desacetyl-2-hydroxyethyl bacteriochlorophyllide A dehydrogenase
MRGKQLWVSGPFEVSVRDFDLPEAPPSGNLLVETDHTLVSAGTELAIVTGTHIGFTTGAAWPRYPMALGYTAVARVIAVGPDVIDVAVGDRVIAPTPHASHAVVEASRVRRLPPNCSAEAALLANLSYIPFLGVRLAKPRLGDGMVVFGQGLIGALASRLGRIAGCRPVVGVDPIRERRRLGEQAGIVEVDPTTIDPAEAHRALADGRLPDIVIEATGAPTVINAALEVAADGGRVVLLGSPRGRVEIDPYSHIHRNGITIIGAHARMTPTVASIDNPFTAERNHRLALALIADGSLDIRGLISHHIRPEDALDTYRKLAERQPEYLGVVIDWRP